ncbi:WD40/YVTN/BNR-like repeat-containing protein [Halopseudomonas xiamenensis]|uniref:WD40/YVTN/BNR-like repeat-containing protein n=1 Tax=Halopseudomonas xiamenensis TaxID=157792 RepID=UPI001C8952FD|nr:YCF48-related protein [Halopseudomonas xiamenensis]
MSSELLFTPCAGVPGHSTQAGALPLRVATFSLRHLLYSWLRYGLALMLFLLSLASFAFQNPTEVPSMHSDKAASSPLTAVAKAGDRMVAVGQRGHILWSDDAGLSWTQASVPVSNDLVAVSFASASHGWAVGHGGVVLNSEDAGQSWTLQLNGEQTTDLIRNYYQSRIGDEEFADAEMLLERENVLVSFGGTQPLMDVYFEDELNGYVVGIFNRLLRTRDGGQSWEPWAHRVDNPHELHFYSINVGADGLYITGEQGMVWRLDEERQFFDSVATPYTGTLFGSAVGSDRVVVFGMRGNAYLSTDQGQNWQHLEIDSAAGITDGVIVGNDAIVLVNLAGELLVSTDRGVSFESQPVARVMPFYGLAQISSTQLALVGAEGAQQLAVATPDAVSRESRVSLFSVDSVVTNSVEHRNAKQ